LIKKENIINKLVAAAEDMLRWKLRVLSEKKASGNLMKRMSEKTPRKKIETEIDENKLFW
jgi:hypothetical protein